MKWTLTNKKTKKYAAYMQQVILLILFELVILLQSKLRLIFPTSQHQGIRRQQGQVMVCMADLRLEVARVGINVGQWVQQQQFMSKRELITKQVEYYFGDKNLENDDFFYTKIQESQDGYIDIAHLLNCNKVKKLGVASPEDLKEPIKHSAQLELHPTELKFRRKDNKPLPQKVLKTSGATENNKETNKQDQNPFKNIQTVIFTLEAEKQDPSEKITFKVIQEALLRTYNLHPPYTRFNKIEGNFALNKKDLTEELQGKLEKEGLDVGSIHIKVRKTEGKEMEEFNEKHGHHYAGIIGLLKKNFDTKKKDQKKHQARLGLVEIEFAGEKHKDINVIKSIFKNMLCKADNNKVLGEANHKQLLELLKHHERSEQKLKDLKEFVVDINKQHPDTRCFYIVKEDGTREDFSAVKCIQNLEKKHAK